MRPWCSLYIKILYLYPSSILLCNSLANGQPHVYLQKKNKIQQCCLYISIYIDYNDILFILCLIYSTCYGITIIIYLAPTMRANSYLKICIREAWSVIMKQLCNLIPLIKIIAEYFKVCLFSKRHNIVLQTLSVVIPQKNIRKE